ncbi:MAG: (Fe-S)-binding protein [Thermoprotei archaeon]
MSKIINIFDENQALNIAKRCSWCGFCESICPTFLLTRDKALGPRGRVWLFIALMTDQLSFNDPTGNTIKSIYNCLTCKACTNACPARIDVPILMIIARRLMVRKDFYHKSFYVQSILEKTRNPLKEEK